MPNPFPFQLSATKLFEICCARFWTRINRTLSTYGLCRLLFNEGGVKNNLMRIVNDIVHSCKQILSIFWGWNEIADYRQPIKQRLIVLKLRRDSKRVAIKRHELAQYFRTSVLCTPPFNSRGKTKGAKGKHKTWKGVQRVNCLFVAYEAPKETDNTHLGCRESKRSPLEKNRKQKIPAKT